MAKKLLVAVDVQNDFVEGGALRYGYPYVSNVGKTLEFIFDWIVSRKGLLVATKDTHDGAAYSSSLEGTKLPVPHCIKGTDGWEFVEPKDYGAPLFSLNDSADIVFKKPTFGTFLIKDYIEQFEKYECESIDEIHFVGYDLSICVLANAVILRAAFPNKRIVVHKDLCGDVDEPAFLSACAVLRNQQIEVV